MVTSSGVTVPQFRGGPPPPSYTSETAMNQLGAHYYQEVPQQIGGQNQHYGNHLDEYDSPILKGSRRANGGPGGRRIHPNTGSSISSSDNNSDTTYAESDINNSLRARMAALDSGEYAYPTP